MKHVLFVDDEPGVLDGLRRMLRAWRNEWETAFANSGSDALALLSERPFDVIVSDMRMPGMDGAQLLDEVSRRWPGMVRIILSGQADRESVLRCVGPTHQYLSKPCDANQLKATVERALALRQWMAEPSIQQLIAKITSLPSLPTLYTQLVAELQSPDCSLTRIGEIVSRDMAMTAKVMQLVNSSYFGLRQRVGTPQQAASVLGTEVLRALVLSVSVFSPPSGRATLGPEVDYLFDHSLAVGTLARALARLAGGGATLVNDSFVAGVVHDIGKLVLAQNLAEHYAKVVQTVRLEQTPWYVAEADILGCTHAEVGAYLLGLWGFPDVLIEAVAFHHTPRRCGRQSFCAATTVHLANCWTHERAGNDGRAFLQVDEDYLATVGCRDKLTAWRQALKISDKEPS
ncbi:MAG TPA: response regulator [Pirellulales bacterium]|nr:response regulator [Pirellulales bacterium]